MAEQNLKTKPDADDPWEDLVVSLLSVNQYSLERTYESIGGLREQGLFNPTNLEQWEHGELVARLKAAGCDRGAFMTGLFALRLANLGALIQSKGLDNCTKAISGRDAHAIEKLLLPVNGIGPKVIANFYLLREIER
ncbi:MAG: hypothetical protein SGI92_07440 [Bryobacteraceae bacterium]|nr:hypothetical protein [Bryobacteraceae bacterium]